MLTEVRPSERNTLVAALTLEVKRNRELLGNQQTLLSIYCDGWAEETRKREQLEREVAELRERLATDIHCVLQETE